VRQRWHFTLIRGLNAAASASYVAGGPAKTDAKVKLGNNDANELAVARRGFE
jgi:hypothetical protein